jgi:hypothetical protein
MHANAYSHVRFSCSQCFCSLSLASQSTQYKQQIAVDLVSPHVAAVENKNKTPEGSSPLDGRMIEVIGEDFSNHLLLPTLEKAKNSMLPVQNLRYF